MTSVRRTAAADIRLVLSSATTTLALLVRDRHLPEVIHWGVRLDDLDAETFDTVANTVVRRVAGDGLPDTGVVVSVCPEQWGGWTGLPGLEGHREGRDWAPRFEVNRVIVDDHDVLEAPAASADEPAEQTSRVFAGRRVVVEGVDEDARLGLRLTIEMEASGLVRARASVRNDAQTPYQLDRLVVCLPVPLRAGEILDFGGRWAEERRPQRSLLGVGTHLRESRHGRPGSDSAFVLHVGEPGFDFAHGEVWSAHTAWSGNTVHYAERTLTGVQVIGGGELLLPGEGLLARRDTYTGPWIYFGHGTGLDAIAAQHHAHLRARSHPVSPERPVTLNVWEAVYFNHDERTLLALAEAAAMVGVERYVLDDGWFGARRHDHAGLGDWVVSPDVWPKGLGALVNQVRSLGMQFGLWFEPEMVNPDSDVARAHPEWVMAVPGREPLTSRNQWVLNIANQGAYAHVRNQMMALLDEYDISYIKWDHNRDVIDAADRRTGRPMIHHQTKAFYRLVDELKAAHPGLEIESCASGGSRVDLEVMEHCDRVWASDDIDPTERQRILRWTAQLLPPEMIGSHIASPRSATTGRQHDLSYRAATAVFGHLGVEWNLLDVDERGLAELRRWIDWYKQNRRVLNGGRLVRVDLPWRGALLHGVVTPGRCVFAYTVHDPAPVNDTGALRLPGLAPAARYRVSHLGLTVDGDAPDPVVLTGAQLAIVGVAAPRIQPEHTRILVVDRV